MADFCLGNGSLNFINTEHVLTNRSFQGRLYMQSVPFDFATITGLDFHVLTDLISCIHATVLMHSYKHFVKGQSSNIMYKTVYVTCINVLNSVFIIHARM